MNARRSTGTFACALLASFAVHAMLAREDFIAVPDLPVDLPALPVQARLAPPPLPAPVTAPPPAANKPQQRVVRAAPIAAPRPAWTPPAFLRESAAEGTADEVAATDEAGLDPVAAAPPEPEPVVVAHAASSTTMVDAPQPLRHLPRRGRISYTVFLGTERLAIGETVQTWDVQNGSYRIGSQSETSGLAAVFRKEKRTYFSEGDVTPQGLRPRAFLMSKVSRGRTEVARARFDWDAGSITWGTTNDRHEASLPAHSQDFLSLLFQFVVTPPAGGRITLPITTGTKFETYELDVLSEETLETPLGALRTVPLRQVRRPGAETIQVWLAADHQHLPVQLRFFGRDGTPTGEQVVSEIRLADN